MDSKLINKIRELPAVISQTDTSGNKTGSWSKVKPVFETKLPPCQNSCPANVPVREIISKIKEKDFDSAAQLFLKENPFPSVTGRVCHHPCQQSCLRGCFDEAIEIRALERSLGELQVSPPEIVDKPFNIGIIGSGPSGLTCGYYLRLYGCAVTIFERDDEPGGMLRYGIPQFRLPDRVLDPEIERLKSMGIRFISGYKVTFESIEEKFANYDALYLGIGAHDSKTLFSGNESVDSVLSGLDFLIRYKSQAPLLKNKKVGIVGGGNTAMDCARVSIRSGADVTIIYRRTRDEMPAIEEEISEAIEEGCTINFLLAPVGIKRAGGRLELECVTMVLGEKDERGRRIPAPVKNSETMCYFDFVICAIGEDVDLVDFNKLFKIENGSIKIDGSGSTNIAHIFAGGDAAGLKRTVADAIASGKLSAKAIINFLEKSDNPIPKNGFKTVASKDLNTDYFSVGNAVKIKTISPEKRVGTFEEIRSSLTKAEVLTEAQRCFLCGNCTKCNNCIVYCPDFAVKSVPTGYEINELYCKGCGICVEECPHGHLSW